MGDEVSGASLTGADQTETFTGAWEGGAGSPLKSPDLSDLWTEPVPWCGPSWDAPAVNLGVKIADWEYLHAEAVMSTYLGAISEAGGKFIALMQQVRGYAMSDGEGGVVTQLEGWATRMQAVVSAADNVKSALTGTARDFIERVDEIDNFVYGGV